MGAGSLQSFVSMLVVCMRGTSFDSYNSWLVFRSKRKHEGCMNIYASEWRDVVKGSVYNLRPVLFLNAEPLSTMSSIDAIFRLKRM